LRKNPKLRVGVTVWLMFNTSGATAGLLAKIVAPFVGWLE